jgi:hypothetical protein
MATPDPTSRPFLRQRATGPFWYGKWSRNGRPVIRALGRAWAETDASGGWRMRRGRGPKGVLTEAQACQRMLELVREHDAEQALLEQDAGERRRRGVTFRELVADYLSWLEDVPPAGEAPEDCTRAGAPLASEQSVHVGRGAGSYQSEAARDLHSVVASIAPPNQPSTSLRSSVMS